MWATVGECLRKFGIKNPAQKIREGLDEIEKPSNTRPVPLNRVGEYCEGEDGNTTLPMEFQGVQPWQFLTAEPELQLQLRRCGRHGENQQLGLHE